MIAESLVPCSAEFRSAKCSWLWVPLGIMPFKIGCLHIMLLCSLGPCNVDRALILVPFMAYGFEDESESAQPLSHVC